MIARVCRYAYAQAKTRALQGRLLGDEDWHFLLRMQSLPNVMQYLGGTAYAKVLADAAPAPQPEAEILTRILYRALFADYAGLVRAVPSRAAHLLLALAARYEAENLKTILRGIRRTVAASTIASLLYDLGSLSRLPIGRLMQVRQLSSAIDRLQGTPYHRPLVHALPQSTVQQSLFPLEMAVDLAVVEQLETAAGNLKGLDRHSAGKLTGCLLDYLNLTWLVRLRHYHDLSPEEAINYTLPGGLFLSLKQLGKLARCSDLNAFLSALEPPFRDVLQGIDSWQQLERSLRRWLLARLLSGIHGDPFQIRLQTSYLLLKEWEIESLRALCTAIQLRAPVDRLLSFVTLPLRGPIRV